MDELKFEVDETKKNAEKELSYRTPKDLLYKQNFYTILREKLKEEIQLAESALRRYVWILLNRSIQGGILKGNFVQSSKE